MEPQIRILKFGSSVLRSEADLPTAVQEIYREWRKGAAVVAVVSAFGTTTDDLLKRAEQLGLPPSPGAVAALLATGEAAASALLTLALQRSGLPATLLDAHTARLATRGDLLDAELVSASSDRIRRALRDSIVVLPGFVGRDQAGRTAVLGRGGSDLTAVFLARELGGSCRLVKDVDGLYTADPARPDARRFATASWETALRVGNGVVQPKAIHLAQDARIALEITAAGPFAGTLIGPGPDRLAPPERPRPRLRVALLGCGTVGGGVLERLLARPDLFRVTGVAVRDRERTRRSGLPHRLLAAGPVALAEGEADVVVELLGSREPARRAVVRALELGKSVVTANKALLAEEIDSLERLAARRGARLLYSAAVGGALPALEAVRRLAGRIRAVSGVLNGTCNYVLDRLSAGDSFETAVAAARTAGFAEADPALDLDGSDAAQKLALLAREAFGMTPRWDTIPRLGIAGLDPAALEAVARRGRAVRLVALAERTPAGLRASVRPLEVSGSHPFAKTFGAGNTLRIETTDGAVLDLSAQGAGRWPTCEAVLADLYDLIAARHESVGATETAEAEEGAA
jgi:homoserine dehydrogenase